MVSSRNVSKLGLSQVSLLPVGKSVTLSDLFEMEADLRSATLLIGVYADLAGTRLESRESEVHPS